MALSVDSVPKLWRLARLDFDPVRQRRILLYPEGAVLLNDTGAAVGEIATILGDRYQTDVSADVAEYLATLEERELIQ